MNPGVLEVWKEGIFGVVSSEMQQWEETLGVPAARGWQSFLTPRAACARGDPAGIPPTPALPSSLWHGDPAGIPRCLAVRGCGHGRVQVPFLTLPGREGKEEDAPMGSRASTPAATRKYPRSQKPRDGLNRGGIFSWKSGWRWDLSRNIKDLKVESSRQRLMQRIQDAIPQDRSHPSSPSTLSRGHHRVPPPPRIPLTARGTRKCALPSLTPWPGRSLCHSSSFNYPTNDNSALTRGFCLVGSSRPSPALTTQIQLRFQADTNFPDCLRNHSFPPP